MAKVKESLAIKYGKGSLDREAILDHIPLEIVQNKKFEVVFQGTWYTGGVRVLPRSIYEYSHLLVFVEQGGPTPLIVPVTSLHNTLHASGTRTFQEENEPRKRHLVMYSAHLFFDRTDPKTVRYENSAYVDFSAGVTTVPPSNAGVITALVGIF